MHERQERLDRGDEHVGPQVKLPVVEPLGGSMPDDLSASGPMRWGEGGETVKRGTERDERGETEWKECGKQRVGWGEGGGWGDFRIDERNTVGEW